MTIFGKAFLMACAFCALLACAHNRPAPGDLALHTRITDDGLKLFELLFPAPNHPIALDNTRRERPRELELTSKRMVALLDQVMAESQYCRDGYVLLGRYAGETTRRLRGECNDRATPSDRERFTNNIERW